MARKLKVTSPKTVDGRTLQYDSKKQPIYSTSIVELSARGPLDRLNAKLPGHLKHEIEEIEVADDVLGIPNSELKDRLQQLENMNEKKTLENKIAELELQLGLRKKEEQKTEAPVAQINNDQANGKETSSIPPVSLPEKTATEKIALIAEAKTAEEVDAIVGTDERKTVIAAVEKRKASL
jgi:hypothetical protein